MVEDEKTEMTKKRINSFQSICKDFSNKEIVICPQCKTEIDLICPL